MNFSSEVGLFYECNDVPAREIEDSSTDSESNEYDTESTESEEAKAEEVVLPSNIPRCIISR
jgi:hypothetical protein